MADLVLEANKQRVQVSMCIDSGADISMIPFHFGKALGFCQESSDDILEIRGVSGGGVSYIVKRVNIILEDMTIPIKIAWALIEEVPLLLGRLDVFPKFKIVFDEQQEIVTFQPS